MPSIQPRGVRSRPLILSVVYRGGFLRVSFLTPHWLVTPMQSLLTYFQGYTGSYGLAIILLTIIVRIVILPLTIYQAKAMKNMQVIQPLTKELQAKYKDQPEKLNAEMMQLYKTHGVNPLASCLPMLIQMPFLYAMFAALNTTLPTGSSIMFLGMDLNATHNVVMTIITVAGMFAQSWLSGAGNDPTQRTMTYMMPVLFGYITWNMKVGVVLYWVTSTIFGIIQTGIYPGFPRFKAKIAGSKGDS